MLNISPKSVSPYIEKINFKSFDYLKVRTHSQVVLKILFGLFIISIICLFLPWTQHIRSNGYVTTLNPYDKPQTIQAQIGGKIESWEVKEGDVVSVGDTILILSEAKGEYLDPLLLENTKSQQIAKLKSADAVFSKAKYLKDQINSLEENKNSKIEQLKIKIRQNRLEINSYQLDLEAAKTYTINAKNQLVRMQNMFDQGIKSLTDLESKRLAEREAAAKQTSIENKIDKLQIERNRLDKEIEVVLSDYDQKKSKIEADIQSADSYRYSLLGESAKFESKYNQIATRQKTFVVTSPVNGRITKILKNGIGEFVKEQESLATIVPSEFQMAVELLIEPMDMPLIKEGKQVRLQFDGWPAIIFSGWPNNSFGTFDGVVYAIDNDISDNGKYRILVIENSDRKTWPDLIRIGSGAKGLLLLNDVKIYYEIWRQLNGFPPDFYEPEKKSKVKSKAPLKKLK